MIKQIISQTSFIAILVGFVFVGFGDEFSGDVYLTRKEGVPFIVQIWANKFETVGNYLMMVAPVVLLILDWRKIFPKRNKNNTKQQTGTENPPDYQI